jgi:hypothetical protein
MLDYSEQRFPLNGLCLKRSTGCIGKKKQNERQSCYQKFGHIFVCLGFVPVAKTIRTGQAGVATF